MNERSSGEANYSFCRPLEHSVMNDHDSACHRWKPVMIPQSKKQYQELIEMQNQLSAQTDADLILIQNKHIQCAQLLSSKQLEWAKASMYVAQLKQNIIEMTHQLHDIHQQDEALGDSSIEALDKTLQNVMTALCEQDHENKKKAQLIQVIQSDMSSRVNQNVMVAEKEVCEAFVVQRRQSQIALEETKKKLTDAIRLSKQLTSEELTLKKKISDSLSARRESEILLSESEKTLSERRRLWDQHLFLSLEPIYLVVSLNFTSNLAFQSALHWRLGFIEMENKHFCKAINHFNAVMNRNSDKYKNNIKTILPNLKKSFFRNGAGGTQKKSLEKAKKAYQENNIDEAILYAEQAIELSKKIDLLDEYSLLMDVYLSQRDWINVGLIYQKLIDSTAISHATRVLIDEKINSVLRLPMSVDESEHYKNIQRLKITSIDALSNHCAHIEEKAVPRTEAGRIEAYTEIQLFMCRASPILAGVVSLELISLFARQDQLENMYKQLTWIDNKIEIPLFQKAWAHFMVAEFLHKQGQCIFAQRQYTLALACLPSLTEAREALDGLLRNKTHSMRFFQPKNASLLVSKTIDNVVLGNFGL